MQDCEILALSVCTYGNGPNEVKERAKDFGVEISNVKQYLAGPDDIDSCYVADAGDSTILAFRGTSFDRKSLSKAILDWLNDLSAKPVSVTDIPGELHKGFSDSVSGLWKKNFHEDVQERLKKSKNLVITGYSKGGALAPIAAAFLDKKGQMDVNLMKICIFEAPRPGNTEFKAYFNKTFPTAVRYEYQDDIVPHLPPAGKGWRLLSKIPELGEILKKLEGIDKWDYKAVGNLKFVNWKDKILQGIRAKLEWRCRLVHLEKLIVSTSDKMFLDHLPQEHLYPVLCGKEWPEGL